MKGGVQMILILTHDGDLHADAVIRHLKEKEIKYFRLNMEGLGESFFLHFEPPKNFFLLENSKGIKLDFNSIKSIWYRRPRYRRGGQEIQTEIYKRFIEQEERETWSGLWLSLSNAFWVNHPFYNLRASNKINQLNVALHLGFQIPKTLITNKPSDALRFIEDHKKVVYKVLGKGRIERGENELPLVFHTNIVENRHLAQIDGLATHPCLFQEYVEKEYEIRITVLGDNVFAAKIDSQAEEETKIDWRCNPVILKYTGIELPDFFKKQCIDLIKNFGLIFGAIDVIYNPEKGYVFLELNPNGQWLWIEDYTGLPISATLAEILYKGGESNE